CDPQCGGSGCSSSGGDSGGSGSGNSGSGSEGNSSCKSERGECYYTTEAYAAGGYSFEAREYCYCDNGYDAPNGTPSPNSTTWHAKTLEECISRTADFDATYIYVSRETKRCSP
ncbi:MAG: hypothetical protein Q4F75_05080, partial [Pseudomonadota bacterium]|nr:hypothetical protein [Pseudomonadota bacterium]